MSQYLPVNRARAAVNEPNGLTLADKASVSAALLLNDTVNLVKVPAGTDVSRVVIKNADLDSNVSPALQAKIGFIGIDGALPAGADAAVAAAGAWGQSAATTTYEIFPPYRVEKDCYLAVTVTQAPATGATGDVHGKVEGEFLGAR